MMRAIGWLLGIDQATFIERMDVALSAPWAEESAFWVFVLVALLVALAVCFYLFVQRQGGRAPRITLGVFRGLLLVLLLLMLADPVVQLTVVNYQRPRLFVVVDGTESMAIEDELPEAERRAIETSVGWSGLSSSKKPTRMDYVQSLFKRPENPLVSLVRENRAALEIFLFDGTTTSQLRKLEAGGTGRGQLSFAQLADQLTTRGQVTALGSVIQEVKEQSGAGRLAGVVLISDFANNSGIAPAGSSKESPVSRLGVPIYAVGVGATEATDLAIDLETDPKLKKAERSNLIVKLRQSGLDGQSATVRVTSRRISGDSAGAGQEAAVGQRAVALDSPNLTIDFPFTPDDAGRYEFVAAVDKLAGEAIELNNQAKRQVNIIDDYLRLMYVAHEPTWEWRFIKEVFHRDKLVGTQGFRTFLASSDPRVRESNVLFLPTMTPKRSEFFATDVLFLDDLPRENLSDRFCQMAKEFVGNLGGGMVVIAGPRFGPGELHDTPLADMLPVITNPNAQIVAAPDRPEFRLKITPHAERYAFMQLGVGAEENTRAWNNLGNLPWYQPVLALHDQAFALAEHPTDKCADGKTLQPLIAVRRYGKGEVVYLGFNEFWRLRRKYGEKYYRQFWSQLIYRLGMSHALGADKRFIVRLDQQQYRAEDKVVVTVEAYDENYDPLDQEKLLSGGLAGELTVPGPGGGQMTSFAVPLLRKGVFEARIPVFAVGSYSLRVKDPVTGKLEEQRFEVTPLSAERRRAVRDDQLQHELAEQSGGRAYDLTNLEQLKNEIKLEAVSERNVRNYAFWATPLWFGAVVALMLGEWVSRKWIRLP